MSVLPPVLNPAPVPNGDYANVQVARELDAAVQIVPVVREFVDIQRRSVETGRVQVTKTVSTESTTVEETVLYEFVETERVPVGRVLDTPAIVRYDGDVMIVPVIEERLVVTKELVLVEEIRVTRRRESRPVQHQVDLRREHVSVKRFDSQTQQWRVDDESPVSPATGAARAPPL